MTKQEIAQNKLNRLNYELEQTSRKTKEISNAIPFGQPNIIGRKDIYVDVRKGLENYFKLSEKIEKQKDRIAMLEKIDKFKKDNVGLVDVHKVGNSAYATIGAKTSINNLDYFKNRLKELEKENEEIKTLNKERRKKGERPIITKGAEITKLKNKIAFLEKQDEINSNVIFNDKKQEIINLKLTKWEKQPMYYFVKGLRKIALILKENGKFEMSSKYYPFSEDDKKIVKELINELNN